MSAGSRESRPGGPPSGHPDLIYDWNRAGKDLPPRQTHRAGRRDAARRAPVAVGHATLRIETKKIRSSTRWTRWGSTRPTSGSRARGRGRSRDVTALCREIVAAKLRIRPNCAARTWCATSSRSRAISPAGRASRSRRAASSARPPIRQFAEDWTIDTLLEAHRDLDRLRGERGAAGHVRDRGHDARPARDDPHALHRRRSSAARAADLRLPTPWGTRRPTACGTSSRFVKSVVARHRPGREDRLARPPRPRPGGRQLASPPIEAGVDRVHGARARRSASGPATRRWISCW